MKADRIIAENTGKPAKGKKAPKPAEPVVTVPEGLTLGDVSFTVLGFRVSVRELNIKRIGRVKMSEPEVIGCHTITNTSPRKRS